MAGHTQRKKRQQYQDRTRESAEKRTAWARYFSSGNFSSKQKAFKEIVRGYSSSPKNNGLFVPKALHELAILAPDQATHDDLILQATDAFARSRTEALNGAEKLEVEVAIANLALMNKIHLQGEHPSVGMIERAKQQTAQVVVQELCTMDRRSNDRELMRMATGTGAEASGLLLLQHFAHESLGESGYTPTMSLLSEDRAAHAKLLDQDNWDISVFCSDDVSTPTYPIQVKYNGNSGKTYNEDIVMWSFTEAKPDTIGFFQAMQSIGNVCINEGSSFDRSVVEHMTEHLLDTMG